MNTVSILIKTDPQVKAEAQETAEKLGYSLSSILNAFLRQFVKTKTINFNAELPEEPNEYFKSQLKKAREDRLKGKASPIFNNAKEMTAWLEKQGI